MKIKDKQKALNRLRNQRFTNIGSDRVGLEKQIYFYVWGNYNGKRLCLGPYSSEEEALNLMYEKNIDGDVHGLRTRDQATATRILKAKSLDDKEVSINTAIQRVRHKGKDINL